MQDSLDLPMGLYVRKTFDFLLAHEIARSKRYPSPLTLLDIGLDISPHDPEILESAERLVAQVFRSRLRACDVVTYSRAEFLILLTATDVAGGIVVAERLMRLLQGSHLTRSGKAYQLDTWMGLASHPGGPEISGDQLLAQASTALEEAHQRNNYGLVCYADLVLVR